MLIPSLTLCVLLAISVSAQTFGLVCSDYADVCDNYSNVVLCHGLTGFLHYDATSDVGTADQRRTAIGCGSGNYCSGTGLQCDEYPYASTYDGGLGCFPGGYNGFNGVIDTLADQGGTRCADGSQNGRHGQAIRTFYSNVLNNDNGRPFLVGYQNDARGPLGEQIRNQGHTTCPDDSTGLYRYRTTPAGACPRSRRSFENDDNNELDRRSISSIRFRNVTSESGRIVTVPYVNDDDAKWLSIGKDIWTHDDDGVGKNEKIISSVDI